MQFSKHEATGQFTHAFSYFVGFMLLNIAPEPYLYIYNDNNYCVLVKKIYPFTYMSLLDFSLIYEGYLLGSTFRRYLEGKGSVEKSFKETYQLSWQA